MQKNNSYKDTKIYKNYERAIQWNIEFGAKINDKPQTKMEKSTIDYRYNIIDEEVKELNEGFKKKDLVEIWDALCDILVTVYGALGTFGYPLKLDSSFYSDQYADHFQEPNVEIFNNESAVKKMTNMLEMINLSMTTLKEYCDECNLPKAAEILNLLVRLVLQFSYDATLDPNLGMQIVNDSNFEKGCKTKDLATKSALAYRKGYQKKFYKAANFRVSANKKFYVVYDKESQKILKSIEWKEPDLAKYIYKK